MNFIISIGSNNGKFALNFKPTFHTQVARCFRSTLHILRHAHISALMHVLHTLDDQPLYALLILDAHTAIRLRFQLFSATEPADLRFRQPGDFAFECDLLRRRHHFVLQIHGKFGRFLDGLVQRF